MDKEDLTPRRLDTLVSWLCDPHHPPVGGVSDRAEVGLSLFRRLFLPPPPLELDEARRRAFDAIIREQFIHGPAREIEYSVPYPKHEFFCYLVRERGYLIHGSTSPNLSSLVPREQADWKGEQVNAIFAASDGVWPIFFAILHPQLAGCSIRNGCFVVDRGEGEPQCEDRFYFFSLDHASLATVRWDPGTVYIVPRDSFRPNGQRPVYFDEWVSEERVPVAARVRVTRDDFPFRDDISGHPADEPLAATWLRYRERLGKPAT